MLMRDTASPARVDGRSSSARARAHAREAVGAATAVPVAQRNRLGLAGVVIPSN
jgi:hypothetical protein